MDSVHKSVRDYLRAADIVIDLLKSDGAITDHELTMLQGYTTRIQSLLSRLTPHA